MNTLHPVQDHFDIIEWGLYTDLSLFVQLNDPEVNKTTVLKDQAAFLQNLCAFDLKLNIVDNGAIIRRHLGFPWSQAPLRDPVDLPLAIFFGTNLKEQLLYWLKPSARWGSRGLCRKSLPKAVSFTRLLENGRLGSPK